MIELTILKFLQKHGISEQVKLLHDDYILYEYNKKINFGRTILFLIGFLVFFLILVDVIFHWNSIGSKN
ncbi:MAG: hypothetical protein CVV64_19235 [Candidatus Wallbacteria bacterium HGW-Wallbacteria-1]|jgi:hypothetical protein|uniref:Uncharacterized protein n=1 Tax=Candidatus Wallbacteria bacterium HGW-Wallbacteria-1 TaxID=2013854 RepID=A0A2N1PJ38_9BACT|nr:MAG: hypothetical protein CVV64_19235 [Candidatus Wallbacteria bacterium HGW-Wallbacteria-1]